jgi:hypothetical protein
MISVLSTSGKYVLQPSLIEMHGQSLEWLSAAFLWKKELAFFQKILEVNAPKFSSIDDKKKIDHFQHVITYYQGELVDQLKKKLRNHESHLAMMLQALKESDTQYFAEHREVMEILATFNKNFMEFKHDFFEFITKALH